MVQESTVPDFGKSTYIGAYRDIASPLIGTNAYRGHTITGATGLQFNMSGGTYSNAGTTYLNTAVNISGGSWDNAYSGRTQVDSGGNFNIAGGNVNNNGTILIQNGGTVTNASGSFINRGTLNATSGTLYLKSGSTLNNTGTVILGDGLSWESGGTYLSNAGTLQTPLKYVASVGTDYQTIYALKLSSSNSATSFTSDVWADGSASINTHFRDNSTINSGSTIRVTTAVTQLEANLIRSVIRSYFPNASVTFSNVTSAGVATTFSKSHAFDAELINALIDSGVRDWTYYQNDWNGNLSVGQTGEASQLIRGNVGFRTVSGNADVADGYTLELVGQNGTSVKLAESASVAQGGALNLGTQSSSYSRGTLGSLPTIENAGTLRIHNGTFDLAKYSGEGEIVTTAKAVVNWDDFNAGVHSVISNAGTMNFARDAVLHSTTNTGTLNFGKTVSLAGDVNNAKGTAVLTGALSFEEGTKWTNADGTIKSVFGNLFDNGTGAEIDPINTIGVDAVKQEAVAQFTEEWFTKYVPASIKDAVRDHMTFDGNGNVVITDAKLTETQRDDLVKAFKETLSRVI